MSDRNSIVLESTHRVLSIVSDKIQARMNISLENKIFHLSTDCRIEVYT